MNRHHHHRRRRRRDDDASSLVSEAVYTEYFIINWINLHADENIPSTAGYKN